MIAFLTLELHIEAAQSIKDRRQVVRSLKDRLRTTFNVSIAELDGAELWNRATIGVVSISHSRDYLDGLMKNVERAATRIANNNGAEVADSFLEIYRRWKPGDEVLVTRLDHDANVRPWVLAARDAGATVRFIDIHPEDCTLDLADLRAKLTVRTKLLAIGAASNVVGTINDVALTAVAGAISRYVLAHREPVKGRFVRLMVPVNVRWPDAAAASTAIMRRPKIRRFITVPSPDCSDWAASETALRFRV